ncbi:MAG: hypothetical protein U5N53_15535 [Mycobacterium sp.]|nr:hypothetical protein [Mycobacterium sp.]
MLPPPGVVPLLAEDRDGVPLGAVWTYRGYLPLRCDADQPAL